MKLTDVDFSFQKNHWLFENNETDQGDCLTAFGFFLEMNNFFSILKLDCCGLSTCISCEVVFDN